MLKIKIVVREILNALSFCVGIAKENSNLPILENFSLVVRNGKVTIAATDLSVSVKIDIMEGFESFGDGTIILNFGLFFKFLQTLTAHEIIIEQQKEQIKVIAGSGEYDFFTFHAISYPEIPERTKEQDDFSFPTADLDDMLKVIPFTTEEKTRYDLSNVFFDFQKEAKTLSVVSTDGKRLAIVKKEIETSFSAKILVPAKNLKILQKISKKHPGMKANIGFTDTHMFVLIDNIEFTSSLSDQTFPPYERVLDYSDDIVSLCLVKSALIKELERSAIFDNDHCSPVQLTINPGVEDYFEIKKEGKTGNTQAKINAKISTITPEPFIKLVAIRYLLDVLKFLINEQIIISFRERTINITEGDFHYCLLPMKMPMKKGETV